ncbi:MAG TPA: hypothetical protein VIY48_03410 [Candidatus Paceibacterota bacterium]
MSDRLYQIANYAWLKHPRQTTFHAYAVRQPGTRPVCGDPHEMPASEAAQRAMEIPDSNSAICLQCFEELYGIDLSLPSLELNKPVPIGSIGHDLSKIEEEILQAAYEHITTSAAIHGIDVEKTLARIVSRLFRELMYLRYGSPSQSK